MSDCWAQLGFFTYRYDMSIDSFDHWTICEETRNSHYLGIIKTGYHPVKTLGSYNNICIYA